MNPPDETPPDNLPSWARPDPWLDENGELPVEEAHHRDRVDAAIETIRVAFPALIIPAVLVLMLLSLLLGDVVWKLIGLFPFLYVLAVAVTPLVARWRKGGALRLPGGEVLTGPGKRKALVAALALTGLLAAYAVYGGMWEVQAREWMGSLVRQWW